MSVLDPALVYQGSDSQYFSKATQVPIKIKFTNIGEPSISLYIKSKYVVKFFMMTELYW